MLEKLPSFFTDEQKNLENIKAQYEKQIQDLYAEVGCLTTEHRNKVCLSSVDNGRTYRYMVFLLPLGKSSR
ncbi:hypothetical protein MOMUL_06220 [Moorella mulderi DSM 14980]|uniref:Uncharacterized protein n=1 Tax=Moorella mulderi DSM 14980 TaxID=1122241 RepID=A0A151B1W3_9FIRM|nr:hypothetical protein MOMUL_06220 [Moorella mulderi DSM 14980]